MKNHKNADFYDFSDYAEEITGNALFKINGGTEVENSDKGVAGAKPGDTITRKNGDVIVLKQADIDYANAQLGNNGNNGTGNTNGNSGTGNNSNSGSNNTSNSRSTNNSSSGANNTGISNTSTSESTPEVSEEIKQNSDAYANYMSLQGRAKDEGEPDRYKGYNVLGEQINGHEVYFIYVYPSDEKNQEMKAYERNSINEEIGYLIQNGVSVKIINEGKYNDIKRALEDKQIKMLVTSGHGNSEGSICTADNRSFEPANLSRINVSDSLKTVIFENCYQGGKHIFTNDNEKKWEEAFEGKVDVVGWKWQTSKYETKRFNNSGWFDRQSNNLMDYCKGIIDEK